MRHFFSTVCECFLHIFENNPVYHGKAVKSKDDEVLHLSIETHKVFKYSYQSFLAKSIFTYCLWKVLRNVMKGHSKEVYVLIHVISSLDLIF